MFVQVFTAPVADAEAINRVMDRWESERRPQVKGFLGSTSGISTQGTFVAVARFESEELARSNSDDPEQTAWWNELSKGFAGEATFHDCTEVDIWSGGGSDKAGFVQVIQGRARDKEGLRAMGREFEERMKGFRPELLGGYTAWDGDLYTDVVYFTSEAEAREGEKKPMPEDVQRDFDRWLELSEQPQYFDLTSPRLIGA